MKKTWDTLYKKNTNGSYQEWTISVDGNTIVKKYGQVGGKIQVAIDVVKEGKNEGKTNATTAAEQAAKEADAQWILKQKKRYVTSLTDAGEGKVNSEHITGGVDPMLAQKYSERAKHIVFPASVQTKLDGIRCIAIIQNGKTTLWTRTRKPINGVPHIIRSLNEIYKGKTLTLDGELYHHDYKDRFEEIVSFVNQSEPKEGHEVVQYHVYDLIDYDKGFKDRMTLLTELSSELGESQTIRAVPHFSVDNEADIEKYLKLFLSKGYEGCMVRNNDGLYEGIRSNNLQKVKKFDDAEFTITQVVEGRGKMAGKAVFVCETANGNSFKAKMEGSLERLTEILTNKEDYIGKKLTVRYQGFTNGNVPRFPVGVCVRDYE